MTMTLLAAPCYLVVACAASFQAHIGGRLVPDEYNSQKTKKYMLQLWYMEGIPLVAQITAAVLRPGIWPLDRVAPNISSKINDNNNKDDDENTISNNNEILTAYF